MCGCLAAAAAAVVVVVEVLLLLLLLLLLLFDVAICGCFSGKGDFNSLAHDAQRNAEAVSPVASHLVQQMTPRAAEREQESLLYLF